MSRMDRMLNSKKDKQTIYEIYRACRLCGAGAGYKMPIIQNVVDLDDSDIELKQKIRECVQIEVHQDDKMPPLICELCVDKVNDFYEFLEMCRQTNKRTRLRLGLPPQSLPGGAPDAGDCILGLTEPVYVNEDSDGEPLSKHKKTNQHRSNVKVKKEPQVKVEPRSSRLSKREPTPPRTLRNSRHSREDSSQRSQERSSKSSPKVSPKAAPKSILKKTEDSLLSPRLKRTRDKDPVKIDTPVKKVKIAIKPVSPPSKPKPARKPSPPRTYKCDVCPAIHKTPQALASHVRSHTVNFTSPRLACNPCREWFPTADRAASHHRQHRGKARPYRCQRCHTTYTKLADYDEHIASACEPWPEVPDVKCESCWHLFATNNLLESHRCLGPDHRPGGKCSKCNRSYALLKNLKKHESTCTAKKKGTIDPALLAKVKPLQVRVSRCDPLLLNVKQEHYDVSAVAADFGLDKNCVYPYISSFSNLRIKSELPTFKGMVAINEEIKNEFCAKEYIHWDSDESESDSDISLLPLNKKVDSLSTLTLKTIFSRKCLGRVPRKKRRMKVENFDSILETEDDVMRDINNIIDNLDNDDDLDAVDEIDRNDVSDANDSGKDLDGNVDQNNSNVSKVGDDDNINKNDEKIDGNDVSDANDSRKDLVGDQNDSNVSKVDDDDNINKNDEKIDGNDVSDANDSGKDLGGDQNDSNVSKVDDDDTIDRNDEKDVSSKINSENEIALDNGTINTSDDKIDDEDKSKNVDDVDSSKNNDNEGSSKNDELVNDESKIVDKVSEECENNNENDGNANDDKSQKDISSDDNLKTKDTSENEMNDDSKNIDDHKNNDENIENHKINDENGDDHKNNDENSNDHQIDKDKEKVNDDDTNDAQDENQINDEITNDLLNNDFQDNKTNLDESTDISKVDTNDNHDSISKVDKNDYRDNVDGNDVISKADTNDNTRDNVDENDENDDQVKENNEISEKQITDSKNDEKILLGELNSQNSNPVTFNENLLNDELKNECLNEETKIAANEDFSEPTNLIANEKLMNDELKNECLNEETKMEVNEDFSEPTNLSAKSDEHMNGDSDYNKLDNNKLKNDEIDDSKLMAALDAQIGESDSVVPEKPGSYGFNDKIALEDLITDRGTEKPLEMDILPEEFNFDN